MESPLIALWVFLAGGSGAVCRYGVYQLLPTNDWPLATVAVNVIGSFVIGILMVFALSGALSPTLRIALMTGFLGGFTTFSAFSVESVLLLNEQPVLAVLFIIGKVVLCIVAAAVGMILAKAFY